MQAALQQIPIGSLASDSDPVRLPARVFLVEDLDYEPLRFTAVALSGGALPRWVRVDHDTGRISVLGQPEASELPLQVQVQLAHSEGAIALAAFTLVADNLAQPLATWTVPLAQRFENAKLEKGVRATLAEHFAQVYDFGRKSTRQRSMGTWLAVVDRMLRLLRSAAGTSLALDPTANTR